METCPCGRVVSALGRHVQSSVTRSWPEVRSSAYQKIISDNSYVHDPSQHADIGPTLLPARQTSALAGEHWLNIGLMSENGLANGWQLVGCNAPNNSRNI